jgi:glycosyltransferase involved in cell wall biosynthesis
MRERVPHRVLFVVPSLRCGGAERVILNLVNHINRDRFVPVLAVGTASGHYFDQLAGDVSVCELGAERSRTALPALVRVVRRLAPRTILSTLGLNWVTAIARPLFPRSTRIILREGSSPSAALADLAEQAPLTAQLHRNLYPWVYPRADLIVCQSDFMRSDLETSLGVPADKITVVENPVDTEAVLRDANYRCNLDQRRGPHLVAVGRLAPEKGIDTLLRAFHILRTDVPSAHLWVLGDGDDRSALEHLTAELQLVDAVHFEGVVKNPFPYVARADLFVSASRYEGLSNAILEALVCGTPVVATACPSGIGDVIDVRENGWLAKPDSSGDLALVLKQGLDEGVGLDRDLIRARAAKRWGIHSIVRAYEDLL